MSENVFPEIKSDSIENPPWSLTSVWSEGGMTKMEFYTALGSCAHAIVHLMKGVHITAEDCAKGGRAIAEGLLKLESNTESKE